MRWIGFLVLVPSMIAACGSDDERLAESRTGGAGGSGASNIGGSDSGGLSGSAGSPSGFGGIPIVDSAPPTFDGPDLADAGWFDCQGCACNGATHYCLEVAGGAKAPGAPPPPDAGTCDDSGTFGCTPLPAECVNGPSCSCIPAKFGGACQCSDVGGGLLMFCALP